MTEKRVIGKSFRKVDAAGKVLGTTLYADDIFLPRMLYGKLLRSTQPHARIRKIDLSKAKQKEGVLDILVGQDLPINYGILPVSEDEFALAQDRVRYVGDPVAAVVALTEEIAEEATHLIEVDYEALPPIMSIEDAVKSTSLPIHEYAMEGNIHKKVSLEFGEVEDDLAHSDEVFESVFYYEGNTHLPIEQHAAVAQFDGDGKLTLWSSTQTPHYVHRALAKVLELSANKVRIIATPVGGGFGGKCDPFSHEIVAAKFAMRTGRPVKITLTREEVFYAHRGRHPVLMWVKAGFKSDGSMTGMDFKSFLDGGGYGSYGVASTFYTGALQTVTYPMQSYRFRGARCFTNKPPCGPKRGHGTPQPRFAMEVLLDKAAIKLGLDPAELRRNHLVPSNSLTVNYLKVGSMGLGACIDQVVKASDWKNKYGKMSEGVGYGIACSSYLCGAGLPIYWNKMPHSGVQLQLDRSGLVTVFCGSTDIGQGSDSILAYIVAEVLGIDPFDIKVVTADTDLTPVDLGSYSSRVTLMTGNAAIQAAERARDLIADAVSKTLEVPKNRLAFQDRRVFDVSEPEKGMNFQDAVIHTESQIGTIGTVGSYSPPKPPGKYKGAGVGPSPAYSYSACVVRVEVDPETGIYQVPKIWIAHDCGQAINRILVEGQVEGSVYMGLGEVMMEQQVFRKGVHKFPSMLEYKSPTTMEMSEIETFLIEDPDPNGPFGAKEVGQGPLLPIMPAVANAIYDALKVRVDQIPISPYMILTALKRKKAGQEGRYGPTSVPELTYPDAVKLPAPSEKVPAV